MTREDIKACCKKISPGYDEYSECDFADNVQTLGFIDTSQGQNGSRGIVFSTNHMMLNTDGTLRMIFYTNITEVRIIDSFEDAFSDELEIVCSGEEFRVSNCSLNKTELKVLIDKLCEDGVRGEGPARITPPPPKPPANTIAVTAVPPNNSNPKPQPEPLTSKAPKTPNNTGLPRITKEEIAAELLNKGSSGQDSSEAADNKQKDRKNPDNPDNPGRRLETAAEPPENKKPHEDAAPDDAAEITQNEEPESVNDEDIIIESDTPVIFESVIGQKNISQQPDNTNSGLDIDPDIDDELDFTEDRLRIQNMTPEETMSFLAQSLSEINAPAAKTKPESKAGSRPEPAKKSAPMPEQKPEPKIILEQKTEQKPAVSPEPAQHSKDVSAAAKNPEPPKTPEPRQELPKVKLTEEPVWGDIYIKASRSLRELCEAEKLTMKQIETELNQRLLESTRAFAEIAADESRIPKVLIPKITELKAAAENFDQYFQLGEDIAVRAMFFMLYQMLSYSDRIVETPETKEGLNDFFRRFGSAGIMLSMLDMRV